MVACQRDAAAAPNEAHRELDLVHNGPCWLVCGNAHDTSQPHQITGKRRPLSQRIGREGTPVRRHLSSVDSPSTRSPPELLDELQLLRVVKYNRAVGSRALAESLRSFNRFYTETIGALSERHEGLDVNLVQSRVLYTVSALEAPEVSQLAEALRLDLPYTSRILGVLEDAKLVRRTTSRGDRRRRVVQLTAAGRRLLAELERRSNARMLSLVEHLDDAEIAELLQSMDRIRALFTP